MRFRIASLVLLLISHGLPIAANAATAYSGLVFHTPPKPLAAGAVTEEWAHFLGPRLNATTPETKLLDRWPASGPAKVWEMEKGEGYACPVIGGGRLVYFHRVDGKETIDCLELETGRRFWRVDYPVVYEDRYGFSPGPRASAVIADGRVTTVGVTAMLHCLDLATGQILWRRDLRADYQIPQEFFGYGPTPLAWRDRLIINVGGKKEGGAGVCVAALDQLTGKTRWELADDWGASYASPIVARFGDREVALVVAAGESRPSVGGLLAIDPDTGKLLDRFPWRARVYESVIAGTPLVLPDRRVYLSECYEKGGALLAFDETLKAKQLWTQRGFGLHWMVPLHRDGHLYGFAGRNPPDTELKCLDLATGKIVWTNDTQFQQDGRVQSFFRGSLLQAGSRVFALGEDGLFAELELSPQGVVTRQRTRLFQANEAWTLPALHRGLLYVSQNTRDTRDRRPPRIVCYDLRGE